MLLHSLTLLVPPPISPIETGSPNLWDEVETRLGVSLPEDYKLYIDCYGTGGFNEFLFPYNPFTANEYLNLLYALETHHQATRATLKKTPDHSWSPVAPFQLYPADEGLLPWGTTINFGEIFFWQVSGPAGGWLTIFYNLRNGEHEVFKTSFSGVLVGLLSRTLESVLLPQDFPVDRGSIQFTQFQ
jgi:hypothetical protein